MVVSGTVAAAPEGLRERKKRETRQQISDVATGLFLERGFDEVRVADIARAAGVSEKTVYNYFETKEALLLDREQHMEELIGSALGPGSSTASPLESFVAALLQEIAQFFEHWDHDQDFRSILRFQELIEGTPSLRAAQRDMMDRLTQVAAVAMAERADVDPDDPEPQIAAAAMVGLWGVMFRALRKQAELAADPQQAQQAVVRDVTRAARLLETGLWSFDLTVQGISGREQLRAAGEAARDASRQVMSALRDARQAWRDAHHEHHHRS
ncbi:MAG: TetR family transcriptional regulator [Frankiales bacterium]|nr:TetR family transcriptional regulator [Frankiales bacterium]